VGGCATPHFKTIMLKHDLADLVDTYEMMFGGVFGKESPLPRHPMWLYKEGYEPKLVYNTQAEEEALADGWDCFTASALSNRHLVNWFWDLEDMSPRQLQVFAQEEYGVYLPLEAGQDKLFAAVVELTRASPQNKNRMVMMAHTIKMNYDETLEEIQRMADSPPGTETENFYEEFTA